MKSRWRGFREQKMNNFFKIYSQIYENNKHDASLIGENIDNFKRWPYTNLKARLYMVLATIVVFFSARLSIRPNSLTIFYASLSLLAPVLIMIDQDRFAIYAILVYYFRGVFDWADGALARLTGTVSVEGGVLDPWAGMLHSYSFFTFIGLYSYHELDQNPYILILLIIFLIIKATNIRMYALSRVGIHFIKNRIKFKNKQLGRDVNVLNYHDLANGKSFESRLLKLLSSILDDRSRSVDTILLFVLIDVYFSINYFLIGGFILASMRICAEFFYSYYFVIYKKNLSVWFGD